MSFGVALIVIALAGFLSLSYEILWFRVFSFVSSTDPTVFGLLLAVYLLGLAIGALMSRRLVSAPRERGAHDQLHAVAVAIGASSLAAYLVVPGLAWLASLGVWPLGYLFVILAAGMFGVVLPVVSHLGIAPAEAVGARLSYLYLANIVGSALGSLLTGLLLADVWSTEQISRALGISGLLLAIAIGLLAARARSTVNQSRARRIGRVLIGGLAAAVVLLAIERPLFDRLYERMLYKRDVNQFASFAQLVETRGGVIAVTPDDQVYGGGAYDGFISTDLVNDRNLLVRAYGLAAMHSRPARVLVVGVAGGAWTQVIASLPGVEHITAVEINEGYLPIIAGHPAVRGILTDPRVSVVIDDGRRWLARHPNERFDAIVMNTTWHYRAHSTNLLSAEFLKLAREHLLPSGILYYNTTYSPDAMKTAVTVFPHALRVLNFMAVSDTPITFDATRWEALVRGLRRPDGGLKFDGSDTYSVARLDSLLALPRSIDQAPRRYGIERGLSVARSVVNAQVITDDNMVSEWRGTQPLYLLDRP